MVVMKILILTMLLLEVMNRKRYYRKIRSDLTNQQELSLHSIVTFR